MSVNITISGGLNPPKMTSITSGARTSVFSANSAKGWVVVGVNLYNTTVGAVPCLLEYYDGTTYWPIDNPSPGAAASARCTALDSVPLRLKPTDSIHITAASGIRVAVDAIFDSGTAPPTSGAMGGAAHS